MKTVLAIDPGKGALGWAFGRGQSLVACGLFALVVDGMAVPS